MVCYCEPGDTVKVSLAGGQTLTFNEPICIECKEPSECYQIKYTVFRSNKGVPISSVSGQTGASYRKPIYPIITDGSVNGGHKCDAAGVGLYGVTLIAYNGGVRVTGAILELIPHPCNTTDCAPVGSWNGLGIEITSQSTGVLLYEDTSTPCDGWEVDCSNCPPNTLDCGDCCLSCSLIFNQLSELRLQLSRIS